LLAVKVTAGWPRRRVDVVHLRSGRGRQTLSMATDTPLPQNKAHWLKRNSVPTVTVTAQAREIPGASLLTLTLPLHALE